MSTNQNRDTTSLLGVMQAYPRAIIAATGVKVKLRPMLVRKLESTFGLRNAVTGAERAQQRISTQICKSTADETNKVFTSCGFAHISRLFR